MKDKTEIEEKIVEHYEKIQSFAQKEIDRTFTIYKFLFWGLTVLFAIGITVGGIIWGKSVADIESKYESLYQTALNKEKERIRKEINDTWEHERLKINSKINSEFEQENIKALVENTAQIRIDAIADKLIAQQVENKIKPIKKDLVDIEIETNSKLHSLIFDYSELGVYNDSRKAFTELYNIASDKSSVYSNKAKEIIKAKIQDLEVYYDRKVGGFGSVVDINISDSEKLLDNYYQELSFDGRFYFIEDFWKNSSHDKGFKVDLLKEIFKKEIGLKSTYYIGKIIVDEYELSFKAYDFKSINDYILKH